jgi:hypothetical protein
MIDGAKTARRNIRMVRRGAYRTRNSTTPAIVGACPEPTGRTRRQSMELTEAVLNDANEDIVEMTFTGDEDEWREIAAVLKESDSDLATEIGLKIREALRTVGD